MTEKKKTDVSRSGITGEQLMAGLGYIEDDLVEEAAEAGEYTGRKPVPRRRRPFLIPAAAAACLAAGIGLWQFSAFRFDPAKTAAVPETAAEQEAAIQEAAVPETEPVQEEAAVQEAEPVQEAAVPKAAAGEAAEFLTFADSYEQVYDCLAAWDPTPLSGGAAVNEAADEAMDEAMDGGGEAEAFEARNSWSGTNTMTGGVDEADIAVTDGSFIYYVLDQQIRITDIRSGAAGDEIRLSLPEVDLSETIREIYVSDDRLTVLTEHTPREEPQESEELQESEDAPVLIDLDWGLYIDKETSVYVYDITDPLHPALTGSMCQDGSYYTSRKIGDTVYLFSSTELTCPSMDRAEASDPEAAASWIPCVNGRPVAAEDICFSEPGAHAVLMSTFRTGEPENTIDARLILDAWGEIYVSDSAWYLYRTVYDSLPELTQIARFGFSEGRITDVRTTAVTGIIRDRFAICEMAGGLRILATLREEDGSINNRLYLLDTDLTPLGTLTDIAPGESVFAARYIGNMAYFITYENTDPLFAADLSDPTSPKLLGEVTLSGFSEYLHPWDDHHLLGIGYETAETGQEEGIKLVMFDISDPADPRVVSRMVLPGNYYSHAISYEYRGILADPEENIIGFAAAEYLPEGYENAYMRFSWDEEKGFALEQDIRKPDLTESCRGLYAGDWFYVADKTGVYAWKRETAGPETPEP